VVASIISSILQHMSCGVPLTTASRLPALLPRDATWRVEQFGHTGGSTAAAYWRGMAQAPFPFAETHLTIASPCAAL